MQPIKIGFIGSDGRSFLAALETSRAKSELYSGDYRGVVVKGTSAMPKIAEKLELPIDFIPTADNSLDAYSEAVTEAFREKKIDYALVMPESLLFEGLVDRIIDKGFGEKIIGLSKEGSFIEADKLKCKELCREAGIPVADDWHETDAKDYRAVLETCHEFLHKFGGAVLKYPYSAAGKGSRIILSSWEIRSVYDSLLNDYKKDYEKSFGKKSPWPLLIESRMSGVEISFTVFADSLGNYQILPTAMDYPERFEGPPSSNNPITGGMGAISPHPFESETLLEMARKTIVDPLIAIMKKKGILRPCVLYPGCFVSFKNSFEPTAIRVCEINIRPGEPEFQPVVKRLRNLGQLLEATAEGKLDKIKPEIREKQISISMAFVTGPGGPDGQKGYPWSYTRGENLLIDTDYMNKKRITIIPSAMSYSPEEDIFKSDGSRVLYLISNGEQKDTQSAGELANNIRNRIINAFDSGKAKIVPREDPEGNRLDLRRDIGSQYEKADSLKPA
jgi:phosphoribosylamine---glycine ligase